MIRELWREFFLIRHLHQLRVTFRRCVHILAILDTKLLRKSLDVCLLTRQYFRSPSSVMLRYPLNALFMFLMCFLAKQHQVICVDYDDILLAAWHSKNTHGSAAVFLNLCSSGVCWVCCSTALPLDWPRTVLSATSTSLPSFLPRQNCQVDPCRSSRQLHRTGIVAELYSSLSQRKT